VLYGYRIITYTGFYFYSTFNFNEGKGVGMIYDMILQARNPIYYRAAVGLLIILIQAAGSQLLYKSNAHHGNGARVPTPYCIIPVPVLAVQYFYFPPFANYYLRARGEGHWRHVANKKK
jgi:hypothetical protein